MTVQLGTTGVYVSTRGYEKAAIVAATVDSLEKDTDAVPLDPGYVHIYIFGMTGVTAHPSVPLQETAEAIPDYRIDGKLVGYFRPTV